MGRRRGGSRRIRSDQNEELLGLSGWVYSDLLLGVAVVFLAAVSFQAIIPATADGDDVLELEQLGEGEEFDPGVRECIAGIALDHIEITLPRDLRGEALAERAMESIERELRRQFDVSLDSDNVTFGFMLAFGGAADPNQGISRARGTSEALIARMPERFERVVSRSYWGGRGSDSVRIDLFPYITEPCDEN